MYVVFYHYLLLSFDCVGFHRPNRCSISSAGHSAGVLRLRCEVAATTNTLENEVVYPLVVFDRYSKQRIKNWYKCQFALIKDF